MTIILESDRLLFRKWEITDLDILFPLLSDPETMKFWPRPLTRQETENWIHNSQESFSQYNFGRMGLYLKDTGELIGDCGFKKALIDGKEENDLGYIIHKNFWHKGFGFEAASAAFEYGIHQLGLKRIVANMEDKHTGSRRVAEKLGLKLEKNFSNPRNRNLNTLLYSWDQ